MGLFVSFFFLFSIISCGVCSKVKCAFLDSIAFISCKNTYKLITEQHNQKLGKIKFKHPTFINVNVYTNTDLRAFTLIIVLA